jgi:prepilin-type N-terminal cleavage/methylation domain-containing protein
LKKRAFTLIELLVVIAIIAILAAILFPVFAQAKMQAKKISDLSNIKQYSLSAFMYNNDSDDIMPLAHPLDIGNAIWTTPWNRLPDSALGYAERQAIWANSLYPYVKNWALCKSPGATMDWLPEGPTNPGPNAVFVQSIMLNSYMSEWNDTAIDSPAQSISFWPGMGTQDTPGYSFSYPLISTLSHGFLLQGQYPGDDYIFSNNGPNCVNAFYVFSGGLSGSFKMFANGYNIARNDGHAKFSVPGAPDNPWYSVNANGTAQYYWGPPASDANAGCFYDYPLSPHYPYPLS